VQVTAEDPDEPICSFKSCPDLVTPMNGHKDSNSTSCDSVVTFSCDACYELVGDSHLTCLPDNTWSSDEPICSLKSCPDLVTPMNGHKDLNYTSCDSVVTLSCDYCYELVGYSQLRCLLNNTRSSDEPVCSLKSCPDLVVGWIQSAHVPA
jgi:hypothetical protein